MRKALQDKTWDVILCDYQLPDFNGIEAIAVLQETNIDIPLLIVSGAIVEEMAVECMRLGAYDYIMKNNFSRLFPAIERELKEAESRAQRKQAEEKLRESLEQLRRAVETTIQVLVMAVEIKDPYTAGHQRRMTNLARTIATEMGLPPEKIEGLRMAGVIHDIGKITLPVEILSKPAKLSDIEFSLIREHARLGYDILKDVESPWPLAEIVLQHHERMDGSGYPRGLKGEEILIEARIIAVADVVEAMASHRPYRPALGIDAALEEIEKNRGLLYDSHVVDACLRVFREKGYQIEGA
jgi:HD-GYP domain-containing protein (c-di-GMP phosphodiesterase class II)